MPIQSYAQLQSVIGKICVDPEVARQICNAIMAAGIESKKVDFDEEAFVILIEPQAEHLKSELQENLKYYKDRQPADFAYKQDFHAEIDQSGEIHIVLRNYASQRRNRGYSV